MAFPPLLNPMSVAATLSTMANLSILLLLLFSLHSGYASSDDRAALLSFAASVSGSSIDNWGSPGIPICNWTGITCNRLKHRIVQLDLSSRSLTGIISPSLSNLSFLSVLDLSDNSFRGIIPSELGALSRLTQLSLSSNLLDGTIPPNLGLLRRLVYLDLGGNLIGGPIPKSLFCNTSLQYIDLSNNSLVGEIPINTECMLPDLRFLLLWSNNLIGPIPRALSNSWKLEWIDLESNYLSEGLPDEVFNRTPYLQFLYLSYNNLSSHSGNYCYNTCSLAPFFASLANCTHLQELELAGNRLSGELPPSIGGLSASLLQLHLEDNHLSGPIPPNLTNLVNLTYLNLSRNLLNGSIPPDINKMKKLERLYLSNNMISGDIPPSIGEILHLGLLDLSVNALSGRIPESLSDLSQLRRLLLHNNQLVGSIPSSLGNCVNLEVLDLSHNQLTGRIPSDVAGLTSLKLYLNLSSNLLVGQLPLELSKMDMILAIDLSSNNLSSYIPPQLGSLVALEYLNLSNNALKGSLPSSIGAMPYLEVLDLSSNSLDGALPSSLEDSSTLKILNLSFNGFTGVVPTEGVFASLSPESFIGNPGLCGSISAVPDCSSKRALHRLPVLLGLICMSSCVLCLVGYPLVRRSRLASARSMVSVRSTGDDEQSIKRGDYPKISYHQLVEATGGFSESGLLGSGRFGRVYKGILPDETRIAVKVLDPRISGEVSGSFRRECQVLKRTRHRNLIRIITACSRPDFKGLVLPLMPNGSLESHLYNSSGRRLSLAQLVSIVGDVAEGMSYLHHYSPVRVVHCDLKPSNVLLDDELTAVVSDFGIARLVTGGVDDDESTSPSYSTSGLLCGSVGYIAPEYGLGGKPTIQGDVYSFGVLLLEIITGTRPTDVIIHEGLTLHEWVTSHYPHEMDTILHETLIHYRHLWSDLINELIELGLVCTQYYPSMRPAMMDVAHEITLIKQALSGQHTFRPSNPSSSVPSSPF